MGQCDMHQSILVPGTQTQDGLTWCCVRINVWRASTSLSRAH